MRLRISHVIIALAALAVGFLLGLPHARAQTVDEITSRGTVNTGVLIDLPPYALPNDKQESDGYDIEVAKLLAKHMGMKNNGELDALRRKWFGTPFPDLPVF